MKNHFLITILIFYTISSKAQVAKEDFAKINAAYSTHEQMYMKVKYDVFKNKDSKDVLQSQEGETKRKGTLLYSKIGFIETVDCKDYKLIVDKEDKNISLLGKDKGTEDMAASPEINGLNLEKMLGLCDKTEFKMENKEQNSYTLAFPDEEFTEVKIIYNKETYFIEKMIMYYRKAQDLEEKDGPKESPRIEITYSSLELNPKFQENDFSYDKFLVSQNGKLVAKDAFKGYTVNNQLFKN